MTYDEAIECGIEISKAVSHGFYKKNYSVYQQIGFDETDLLGYLYEEVLCKKYLPLVEEKPDYYTKETFRASFYTACQRRMMVHYTAHIESQKRGNLLRGGITELDRCAIFESKGHHIEGTVQIIDNDHHYFQKVRQLIDECEDSDVWKALALLAYGSVRTKTELSRFLSIPRGMFNNLWDRLMGHVKNYDLNSRQQEIYSFCWHRI